MSRSSIVTTVAVALVGCGALLGLAGCGHSTSHGSPARTTVSATNRTTTSTAVPTTVDPKAADIAAATAAYDRWADLVLDMTRPDADWSKVDLHDYLAGPLLAHIEQTHAERKATGETVRRPTPSVAGHSVMQVKIEGDQATIEICEVDDAVVESREGVVLNDNVTTFHDRVTAVRGPNGWRLFSGTRLDSFSGAQECA